MPRMSSREWEIRQQLANLAQGQSELTKAVNGLAEQQRHQHNDIHDMDRTRNAQLSQMSDAQQKHHDAMMNAQRIDTRSTLIMVAFGFVGIFLAIVAILITMVIYYFGTG